MHHNIRNALESHDNVEMHAAIFAAARFAARSKTFAVNMCSKISDMIKGYATPLDMKLRLIPIFQVWLPSSMFVSETFGESGSTNFTFPYKGAYLVALWPTCVDALGEKP